MLGPVDYVVVGFEGNNFDGSVLAELKKAAQNGIIRVLDLVFIMKEADGSVVVGEFSDQSDELKASFGGLDIGDDTPLLTENDIAALGEDMEPNTAAGAVIIEHLWAKGLKQALIDAGGYLLADGRIHPDDVEADLAELNETKEEK